MTVRAAVVHHAFAVQIGRNFGNIFIAECVKINVAADEVFAFGNFNGTGIACFVQALLYGVKAAVHIAVASYFAAVEHA